MTIYHPERQNFAVRPDDKRLNPKPRNQFGLIYWENRSYGLKGHSAVLPDGRAVHGTIQCYTSDRSDDSHYSWQVEVRQHPMYREVRNHPEPLNLPTSNAQKQSNHGSVNKLNGISHVFGRAKTQYLAKQMVERAAALIGFHPPKRVVRST